jgi:hypothetical protein
MRSFLAMGGGVGLGTLPVTHGLGPEPARPPPPPPTPAAAASNADEREAIWERQRQVMRDWNVSQQFWQQQQQTQENHERMMEDLRRAEGARAEQERIRAADVVYRFQASDPPDPFGTRQAPYAWSTAGTSAPADQARPVERLGVAPGALEPGAPALDAELVPPAAAADYAIFPFGDEATIQAMADGTLDVYMDPRTGLTAVLETESGQRYVYGRVGRVMRHKVKAGDTIGFTPAAKERAAAGREPEIPGAAMPPPPPGMGGAPPAPQLGAPAPKMRWPTAAREKQPAAFAGGPPVPPLGSPPWMREPPPPERPARAAGALLLFGLGVALLAGSGRKSRRR